jgi:hypothetical protein
VINRGLARLRKLSRQSGQDLVEFAIILPLLLLVAFGVFDLGRLFHAGITITNAARVGARYGALFYNASEAEIIAKTREEAQNTGIDLSSTPITVSCIDNDSPPNGCEGGDRIRITISYNFDLILSGLLPLPQIPLVRHYDMLAQ